MSTWNIHIRWRLKRVIPVSVVMAAGRSGLVKTDMFWNAFREVLNKSCFEFSDNSWILVFNTSTTREK